MICADLRSESHVVRFINDDAGTYIETPIDSGSVRRPCSPYHLYRVLDGASYQAEPVEFERTGDDVSIHLDDASIVVPADCFESALSKAFGIGRATD